MVKKKILITGSRGIVGKALVEGLSPDYEIYQLDRKGPTLALFGPWIPGSNFFKIDIATDWRVRDVFASIGELDYVIHLAAIGGISASWKPILANNIVGTRNIFHYAQKSGVKRVIFASTNQVTAGYLEDGEKVLPELGRRQINVTDPVRPSGYYASSKVLGEAIARQFYDLHGLSSICLRIGTVFRDNNPTRRDRHRKTWLSHRDLIQVMRKSLVADVGFGIYYAVSNNRNCFWDISNARRELDFHPIEDGSLL